MKTLFLIALVLLPITLFTKAEKPKPRFCEKIDLDVYKDAEVNRALEGHTFSTQTVQDATECQMKCILDIKCLSINYRENTADGTHGNCDLNHANQAHAPKHLVVKAGTYFYNLKRRFSCQKDETVFDPSKHTCPKSACGPSTCPSHATCREMCLPKFKRFICECKPGRTADCEGLPRTCHDVMTSLGFPPSNGRYFVYDSQDKLEQVYCDFSEPGLAFTLIESFSLANNQIFKSLGYITDAPFDQDAFNWEKYRMSKRRMQYIASRSSHIRSTCGFPSSSVQISDYFRAKLHEDLKLFEVIPGLCLRYERLNVLGKECRNCTVGTWQKLNRHLHVNLYYSKVSLGCEFGGPASGFPKNLQVFGVYIAKSPTFRCIASDQSTTQFWLGGSK